MKGISKKGMLEMSEMVERAAKAMFESDQAEPGHRASNLMIFGQEDPVTWEFATNAEVGPVLGEDYRRKARAALIAMREPTDSLADAGVSPLAWATVIDAALKD